MNKVVARCDLLHSDRLQLLPILLYFTLAKNPFLYFMIIKERFSVPISCNLIRKHSFMSREIQPKKKAPTKKKKKLFHNSCLSCSGYMSGFTISFDDEHC